MENTLYIIKKDTSVGPMYQLCIYPLHYCLASVSSIEKVGEAVRKFYKEFGDEPELLIKAIKRTTCGGKVSTATFEQREEYYKEHGKDFKDFIVQCLKDVKTEKKERFKRKFAPKKKGKGLNLSKAKDSFKKKEDSKESVPQRNLKARFKFNHR